MFLRTTRTPLTALVVIAAGCSSGCLPTATWLPDSSGFVYTEGAPAKRLVRYDLAKGRPRVLVEDTEGDAHLPAVSPDGKRVAVAQGKEGRLRVILFDLDGKELQRSQFFSVRRRGCGHCGSRAATLLVPEGRQGSGRRALRRSPL